MFAVIRLRGSAHLRYTIGDTMKLMRLNQINHCVLIPENETSKGMLKKTKDYITWGEIDAATLAELLAKRGMLMGDKPLDAAGLKATGYASHAELAKALIDGKVKYGDIPGIKPILRLHPARKGLEGIKRGFKAGGALGYRGKEINELVRRML